jgi:hypothetical protein
MCFKIREGKAKKGQSKRGQQHRNVQSNGKVRGGTLPGLQRERPLSHLRTIKMRRYLIHLHNIEWKGELCKLARSPRGSRAVQSCAVKNKAPLLVASKRKTFSRQFPYVPIRVGLTCIKFSHTFLGVQLSSCLFCLPRTTKGELHSRKYQGSIAQQRRFTFKEVPGKYCTIKEVCTPGSTREARSEYSWALKKRLRDSGTGRWRSPSDSLCRRSH